MTRFVGSLVIVGVLVVILAVLAGRMTAPVSIATVIPTSTPTATTPAPKAPDSLEEIALKEGAHATASCSIKIVRKDTPIEVRTQEAANIYETGEKIVKELTGQARVDKVRLAGVEEDLARAESDRVTHQAEVDRLNARIATMEKSLAVAKSEADLRTAQEAACALEANLITAKAERDTAKVKALASEAESRNLKRALANRHDKVITRTWNGCVWTVETK